tara:strand:+ start:675 stop:998 length:324 start_codon:yes stop_codon:yes gene_type:complete
MAEKERVMTNNKVINYLRNKIRYNKKWLRAMEDYFLYKSITDKASKEAESENLISTFIIKFINLPTKLMDLIRDFQDAYTYNKLLKETECIEKEIENMEKGNLRLNG